VALTVELSLIGGFIATGFALLIAYYGSIAAYRLGLDPDNHGIPLITSSMDLVGAIALILAIVLVVIAVINAAIGAWYYLRIAAVMYLRTPLQPLGRARFGPVLVAVWVCALATLAFVWTVQVVLVNWLPEICMPSPESPRKTSAVCMPSLRCRHQSCAHSWKVCRSRRSLRFASARSSIAAR